MVRTTTVQTSSTVAQTPSPLQYIQMMAGISTRPGADLGDAEDEDCRRQ